MHDDEGGDLPRNLWFDLAKAAPLMMLAVYFLGACLPALLLWR